ncbi:GNAT superfamily N-acetyltransferase [Silvibacterium bohemicum]|uniref:GNAT superfamily N-acetyltransferase n=1 Tax=Silvibacterium bohemicum TaxID=1577686 RepID=A0A841K0Y6_9BACT|nr:GNAT family N-acetyltransferase [Silvibacterium bohemicum]MBB6147060.1 GNAT superfamily N-acetyltransferase [Silvibacterium bohemicum]
MILIRPAVPADIPLIRALIQELAEYEREPHSVHITEEQLLRDGFGKNPEDSRYFACLIAEIDGAPAGFALYFPIYSTWQGRSLHLEDLFVRPEFRGQGAGKALLRQVAAIAVERGCARLQWDVLEWNKPAIDFYRSLDATMLDDWRRMRVTGDALSKLADVKIEAKA